MQTTTPDKQNRKKTFKAFLQRWWQKPKNGKINAFLRLILGKRTLTYSNRNAACRFNLPRLAGRSYFFYPHVANSQAQRLIVSRPNIQVTDDDKAVHEPIKKWNKNIWHKTKLNSIRKIKRHGADREKIKRKQSRKGSTPTSFGVQKCQKWPENGARQRKDSTRKQCRSS